MLARMPMRLNTAHFVFRLFGRGALTPQDVDYREPLGSRVFAPATVPIEGQLVGYRAFFDMERTQTGESERSKGAAVFRPVFLEKAGIVLQIGDRIIKVNLTDTDFSIIHVSPYSPYRGRHLLTLVEWEQRRQEEESV